MKSLFIILFVALLLMGCGTKNYLDENESDKVARMEWWKDAKFGMFIHWGAYSVPQGWYKGEMIPSASEWIMFNANIPIDEYEKYVAEFNPTEYNPEEWVRIAKDAGMKYIVITSKHHDGFCIWDSKITNYDIVDFTDYKKDLLLPLAEACKKEGIKLGFYHSIMDWHHPDATGENFAKYREYYLIPQLEELLYTFPDLSILWFDGEWIDEWTEEQGRDLYNRMRNISPNLIINNRVGKGRQGMQGMNKDPNAVGDFGTPEQEILETSSLFPWEACMTMNDSWGFKKGDNNWKSSETLIYNIIDIASKGGNYLLNIGPDSKGNIPIESVDRLKKIGKWMKINGEGIYKTKPIKNYIEGDIIKYTKSKNSDHIYCFILEPVENIRLKYITPHKESEMFVLGNSKSIEYSSDNNVTIINLPSEIKKDSFPICIKIKGKENKVAESPLVLVNNEKIKNTYLFQNEIEVELLPINEEDEIYFTLNGSVPTSNSTKYSKKITFDESIILNTMSSKNEFVESPINRVHFYKIENIKDIQLKSAPSEKYSGNGKLTIVDGKLGSEDFQDNAWLGFEEYDFAASLDLGKKKNINSVTVGFLSNINSWIFVPKKVSFYVSNDNSNFTKVDEYNYQLLKTEKHIPFRKDISARIAQKCQYVKIIAENIGFCPDWHKGSGGKAWIFVDEIMID